MDGHLQWNGLAGELSDFQRGTVMGCHLSSGSVFCPAGAVMVGCTCFYCGLEVSGIGSGSAVKWWATEAHRMGVLKHILCRNHLSSVSALTAEFQTAS